MKDIKLQWLELLAKVDALSVRERILVFLAVVALMYAVWDISVDRIYRKDRALLEQTLREEEARQKQLSQTIEGILGNVKPDPNLELKKRLGELKSTLATLEARKDELSQSFVHPGRMVELLRGLLASGDLRLVSLETSAAAPLLKIEAKEADDLPVLYKHEFMLDMEGGYFGLVEYLRALEQQPLFWESIEYRVTAYPKANIRLKVYILGFERN